MRHFIINLLKWLLDIMEKPKTTKKIKVPRSSVDGRFVIKQYANENPATTIIETVVREVNAEVTEDNDHENETML